MSVRYAIHIPQVAASWEDRIPANVFIVRFYLFLRQLFKALVSLCSSIGVVEVRLVVMFTSMWESVFHSADFSMSGSSMPCSLALMAEFPRAEWALVCCGFTSSGLLLWLLWSICIVAINLRIILAVDTHVVCLYTCLYIMLASASASDDV